MPPVEAAQGLGADLPRLDAAVALQGRQDDVGRDTRVLAADREHELALLGGDRQSVALLPRSRAQRLQPALLVPAAPAQEGRHRKPARGVAPRRPEAATAERPKLEQELPPLEVAVEDGTEDLRSKQRNLLAMIFGMKRLSHASDLPRFAPG